MKTPCKSAACCNVGKNLVSEKLPFEMTLLVTRNIRQNENTKLEEHGAS